LRGRGRSRRHRDGDSPRSELRDPYARRRSSIPSDLDVEVVVVVLLEVGRDERGSRRRRGERGEPRELRLELRREHRGRLGLVFFGRPLLARAVVALRLVALRVDRAALVDGRLERADDRRHPLGRAHRRKVPDIMVVAYRISLAIHHRRRECRVESRRASRKARKLDTHTQWGRSVSPWLAATRGAPLHPAPCCVNSHCRYLGPDLSHTPT
jgi:hypothetical protein